MIPKLFIKKLINKETHLFDYVGSSTWIILKLLENNFDNFLNKKFYYYPNLKPFVLVMNIEQLEKLY